jgi:hypothetical protein
MISEIPATCTAHLILDLITLIIFVEVQTYKLYNSSVKIFLKLPVTYLYVLHPVMYIRVYSQGFCTVTQHVIVWLLYNK